MADDATAPPPPRGWTADGRLTVAAMVAFAACVVAGFWVYWGLSNRPFRELQRAILAEYPETFPQVAGGVEQTRGADGPRTLRLVVRTLDFDPNADAPRAEAMADRLEELAWAHVDPVGYERLETVLFHKYRERRGEYWTRDRNLSGQSQTTR